MSSSQFRGGEEVYPRRRHLYVLSILLMSSLRIPDYEHCQDSIARTMCPQPQFLSVMRYSGPIDILLITTR